MPSTAPSAPDGAATLHRFALTPRVVHGVVGLLMLVCIGTAAVLYIGSLALLVGHRHVVELVHVWAGIATPVPLLLGLLSPAYRDDMRRLSRFSSSDGRWLRSRTRRDGRIRVGKFNAGQKLNGSLSAGSIGVLLMTGLVMFFPQHFALSWRSGSTFVHDWFALGLGLLVMGHLMFASNDRIARRGMLTGRVPASWARAEHAAWVDEVAASARRPTGNDPRGGAGSLDG